MGVNKTEKKQERKTIDRLVYYPPDLFAEFAKNCHLNQISMNKKLLQLVYKFNQEQKNQTT